MDGIDAQPNPRQFGPVVRLAAWDAAAPEVEAQSPVEGQLYRVIPGPDRPDYSIVLLRSPVFAAPGTDWDLHAVPEVVLVPDRAGRQLVRFDALVVCSRYVGEQLHPGMRDLVVNVAGILDPSVLGADRLDFAACRVLGVAELTEVRAA